MSHPERDLRPKNIYGTDFDVHEPSWTAGYRSAMDDASKILRKERAALLQRVRNEVIGPDEPTDVTTYHGIHQTDGYKSKRNALRATQRKVLDNIGRS